MDRIDLRVGRILEATLFARARRPAYKLRIDFGPILGTRQSSAQITFGYPDPDVLGGQQVVAVVNFAPRNVAGFMSQVLVTGFYADETRVLLLHPSDGNIPEGTRLGLFDQDKETLEAEIIPFNVFMEAQIVMGRVLETNKEIAVIDCGPEHGQRSCRVPSSLTAGQRVAVLLGAESAASLIGAQLGAEFKTLTADECVPIGCRLA